MNRIRKDNKGVSPVIATILMVAITVVLAGVLVVYLQTLPTSGGSAETTLGLRTEKISSGWMVSVTGGSKDPLVTKLNIIDPATGQTVLSPQPYLATSPGGVFTRLNSVTSASFNDNNGNQRIDAGDTIIIYDTLSAGPGLAMPGYKVLLLKGEGIIGQINELPN